MKSQSVNSLKRLVPKRIKRAAKEALLARTFQRAVKQIMSLPTGQVPERDVLNDLLVGWGNDGMAADLDYVEEVAKWAAQTEGPVLECGSGLTTIILGLLAGRRGVSTWSLEHHPEWHTHVNATLQRHHISNVNVCLSPLRSYGEFSWYELPSDGLPEEFRLVICDGPPESTPGGRYGLLPVLGPRLSKGTIILLDDANRASETEALKRWEAEAGVQIAMQEMSTGAFALVTCR